MLPETTTDGQRDYLVILSGPEPQRTILEKKLMKVFDGKKDAVLLVRGLLTDNQIGSKSSNVMLVNFLSGCDLRKEVMSSKVIICRPGYSTIMDLVALGNKLAIFIPTPGQTEQEYLAKYHQSSGSFCSIIQNELTYSKLKEVQFSNVGRSSKVNDFKVVECRIKERLILT